LRLACCFFVPGSLLSRYYSAVLRAASSGKNVPLIKGVERYSSGHDACQEQQRIKIRHLTPAPEGALRAPTRHRYDRGR
jgi:hypothetical protein